MATITRNPQPMDTLDALDFESPQEVVIRPQGASGSPTLTPNIVTIGKNNQGDIVLLTAEQRATYS